MTSSSVAVIKITGSFAQWDILVTRKGDFRAELTSCRVDVQAYPGGGTVASCLADEQRAKDVLVGQWAQFAPESRATCTKMVNDGAGAQSYVELLSCLQDAKDVKTLPKD
jgi:hypothetical protein